MTLVLPATPATGRYRLVKNVHPPFERQGIQPTIPLNAEFSIVHSEQSDAAPVTADC